MLKTQSKIEKNPQYETMSIIFVDGVVAPSTNIMDMVAPYAHGFVTVETLKCSMLVSILPCLLIAYECNACIAYMLRLVALRDCQMG